MNGDGIGTLSISIVYDNGKKTSIWELTGDKGDQWLEGNIRIDSLGLTYRFHLYNLYNLIKKIY